MEQDIEQILAQGNGIRVHPRGYSMYPLFVPGRDEAVIVPLEDRQLKRGDVALYRRQGSILVLHRVYKVTEEGIYFMGDNQCQVEGPLQQSQVRGILAAVIRKGREISVHHPFYVLYSRIWLCLSPFRRIAIKIRFSFRLFSTFFRVF